MLRHALTLKVPEGVRGLVLEARVGDMDLPQLAEAVLALVIEVYLVVADVRVPNAVNDGKQEQGLLGAGATLERSTGSEVNRCKRVSMEASITE
jgi:hypothetical protein